MKKTTKILGLILSGMMLFSFVGCSDNKPKEQKTDFNDISGYEQEYESNNLKLSFLNLESSQISLFSATSNAVGISKVIEATVLPETAPDKRVDWIVSWVENKEGANANVSDYLVVTPNSDGSTKATVTCKKAFANSTIKITVKTRVGGFTAECYATYEGTPTEVSFSHNNTTVPKNGALSVGGGKTYSINLKSVNQLGESASKYQSNFELVSIEFEGKLDCLLSYYSANLIKVDDDVTLDFKELETEKSGIITASIANNVLTINAKQPFTALRPIRVHVGPYKESLSTDNVRYFLTVAAVKKYANDNGYALEATNWMIGLVGATTYFVASSGNLVYASEENPHTLTVKNTNAEDPARIIIKVKEKTTGITSDLVVKITSDVSGVRIDKQIIF